MTGDITPAYAFLTPQVFGEIREGLRQRGFAVRVVFLMRDPVERCISAAKHATRPTLVAPRDGVDPVDWRGQLRTLFKSPGFERRTLDDHTIACLEQVFAPEELHYAFCEDFFDDASLQALTRFLGIDFPPGDYGRNAHPAQEGGDIDPALCRQIRERHHEVYRFGAERAMRLRATKRPRGPQRLRRLAPPARESR